MTAYTCPICGEPLSGPGLRSQCPKVAPPLSAFEIRTLHALTTARMPGAPFDQQPNTEADSK